MRFWLDKGVDGFRMDVINLISKDLSFPEDPAVARWRPRQLPGCRSERPARARVPAAR